MIRRIDRYLIGEFLPPFSLGLFVLTFTLLTNLIVRLTEWFINKGVSLEDVARTLLLSLPYLMVLAIPMAVLVGILMALGRMSADSEIIAFKAGGVSVYRMFVPLFVVALLAYAATSYLYIIILPRTNLSLKELKFKILKSQADIGLKPQVFNTFFENQVLYIDAIDPKTHHMLGVFLAANDPENSKVFFANEAEKLVDEKANRVTMVLRNGIWHRSDAAPTGDYGIAPFDEVRINLQLKTPTASEGVEKGYREMTLDELKKSRKQLMGEVEKGRRDIQKVEGDPSIQPSVKKDMLKQMRDHVEFTFSRVHRLDVEYNKKFALPFACIIFAIIGVPLGIRSTRSGRSAGFAISIGLFIFYYILLVGGEGLGNEGKLPPALAIWGANLVFGLVGLALILLVGRENLPLPLVWLGAALRRLTRRGIGKPARAKPQKSMPQAKRIRLPLLSFPRLLDLYIARDWLVLFLGVTFTITALSDIVHVFEKLNDFQRGNSGLRQIALYIAARTPGFAVITIHVSALVATVLTISGLNRRSELTAIRASGVSLARVALPVLLLGLLVSGGVWILNERIIPQTNRLANDRYDYEIRGRQAQTMAFNKNWFRGSNHSVFYYTVRETNAQGQISLNRFTIFQLGPRGLPILRIEADKAVWDPRAKQWNYERALIRLFDEWGQFLEQKYVDSAPANLVEEPKDLEREIGSAEEMNYWQLRDYIKTLEEQATNATEYKVDLYGKISFCLISFVMTLVGFPFAAMSNRSGKLAWGIVISIVIGVTFFVAFRMGISIGHSGKLEPVAAAFLPLGVYLALGGAMFWRME